MLRSNATNNTFNGMGTTVKAPVLRIEFGWEKGNHLRVYIPAESKKILESAGYSSKGWEENGDYFSAPDGRGIGVSVRSECSYDLDFPGYDLDVDVLETSPGFESRYKDILKSLYLDPGEKLGVEINLENLSCRVFNLDTGKTLPNWRDCPAELVG